MDEKMTTFENLTKEKFEKVERDVSTLDSFVRNNFKQKITDKMQIYVLEQRVAIEKGLMKEIEKKTTRTRI
jgi:hypothetical protein